MSNMFVWGCCFGYMLKFVSSKAMGQAFTSSFYMLFLKNLGSIQNLWLHLEYHVHIGYYYFIIGLD